MRLHTRVQYAANFVSIYTNDLLASQRAQALNWFATPVVSQGTLDRDSAALGLQVGVVIDTRGHVIRAASGAPTSLVGMLTSRYANLAGVFSMPDASGVAISNINGSPMLSFGVAYQTSTGRRVFAGAYAMSETVLPTVLGSVLSNSGWRAYLVDLHGALLKGVASVGPQPSTARRGRPAAPGCGSTCAGRLVQQPSGQAVLRHRAGRGNRLADRPAETPRPSSSPSSTAPAGGWRGWRSPGSRWPGWRSSS